MELGLKKEYCKKVTVVIPVYKVEKYLRNSVQSVLEQTYPYIDIILVDDGSPDECPEICDEYANYYAFIMVVHKKNGGLSSARNTGINALQNTDYVVFLDSDDTLLPDAIFNMMRIAQEEKADVVIPDRYTKVDEITGESKICLHFPRRMYYENPRDFAIHVMIEQGRAWRASSLLYSYEIIKKSQAKFPEGHIAEDISFNLLIFSYARKIAFYPVSTLNCLKRSGSITMSFQKDFEKDIWYIDREVRKFLDTIKVNDKYGNSIADSLLCRNIVVYLFNIMSHKNCTMNYKEKKSKAQKLLNAKEARNCVRKKQIIPYFEQKKIRIGICIVYWMLQHNMDGLVYCILSLL